MVTLAHCPDFFLESKEKVNHLKAAVQVHLNAKTFYGTVIQYMYI